MQAATKSANIKAPENMFKYFLLEGDEETLERLYADENGEYGGGNLYTKTLAEGWSDVEPGHRKDYGNGATGWTEAVHGMNEPKWGAQRKVVRSTKGRDGPQSDDERDEIAEQTRKRKDREAEKVRTDKAAATAKAAEDARVDKRVNEEMVSKRSLDIQMALAAMSIQEAEEALAALRAGRAPGEKFIEGNTWGAGFTKEMGRKEGGGTDKLNTDSANRTQTEATAAQENQDANPDSNTNTNTNNNNNTIGQQGREAN
ncbi:hypothetical protein FIBSPDRAFT_962380 [Athelia psychrophila]|uniref:Uncharacterized protein n=1 Tax=Athelia psychrophila TaxID=1759441 RepID=A0A166A5W2_9AGAM|nr:hypothetical protein FIBSPDRAFT_962380 [Fibularhizoctonia sp. CBS 109695]